MSTGNPEWVHTVQQRHRNALVINFSRPGEVPTLTVSPRQGSQPSEISLDTVEEERLALDLTQMNECMVRDTSPGLTLSISGGSNRQTLNLTLAETVQGPVELASLQRGMRVAVAEGASVGLAVVSGQIAPSGEALDHPVELAGGWLDSGNYGHVQLRGETPWKANETKQLTVGVLELLEDTALEISSGINCTVEQLKSREIPCTLHLKMAQDPRGRSGSINFTIGSMSSMRLVAESDVTTTVRGPLRDVLFAGQVQVVIPRDAALDGPRFESHNEKLPRLKAESGSVVTGIEGAIVVQGAGGASLAGTGDGFHIAGTLSPQSGGPRTDYFSNAYLRNFIVKPGPQGHTLLTQMDNAHQVEPSTANLPGWGLRYRWSLRAGPVDRRDAEFMRKLSELADTKGASGSVRTKVGWCTQRLRHETTSGWVERRALDGYRCLGYGERPGPPLLTWIALSLVFTLLLSLLGHATVSNPYDFLTLWANRAASPIGAILGTGTAAEDSSWLYLVRAIVAIPLVVAALCLRKYVRAGK